MSVTFRCGDGAALVGYLYDECEPMEAAAIAAHLFVCAACTTELVTLRDTRAHVALWTPPDVQLGFQLVTEPREATLLRPARWWHRPLPAWGQIAAAALIFGAGLTLGVWRSGARSVATLSAPSPSTSAGATLSSATSSSVSQQELADLETRLRDEIAQIRTTSRVEARPTDSALLQQVRTLIDESERRQQRELALRTAEVVRDFDAQRRGDLTRIERTFGQMEGTTGAQVEQQRQMLNYLMRVSQRQGQ